MSPEQARAARPISGATSGRSAPCSTRCCRARARSRATMSTDTLARRPRGASRLDARCPPSTPPAVRQLLSRCLDRDAATAPARHRRSAHRARGSDDATPLTGSGESARAPSHSHRWLRAGGSSGAAVVAAAALGARAVWPRRARRRCAVIALRHCRRRPNALLVDPQSRDLAITPDGTASSTRAAAGIDRVAAVRLCTRPTRTEATHDRPACRRARSPRPTASGLASSSRARGPRSRRCRSPADPRSHVCRLDGPSRGATWGDDDTIIVATAAPATGLLRIAASAASPRC